MARIRTIKPEFWDSPGIETLDFEWRLLYMAMWNWADDSGRGKAEARELMGFAFPRDEEMTLGEFRRGLGGIRRTFGVNFYKVDGRSYFAIPSWEKHQKIDKRSASRWPAPEDGEPYDPETNMPVDLQEQSNSWVLGGDSAGTRGEMGAGTGEQGNRGTGESNYSSSPQAATETERPSLELIIDADPEPEPAPKATGYTEDFEEFWKLYPRTAGKGAAAKAYDNARKVIGYAPLLEAVQRFASDPNLPTGADAQFIPHAKTWLNERRWEDGPLPVRRGTQQPISRKEQTLAFLHQEFLKGDDSPPPFGAVTHTTQGELTA